MSSPPQPPVPLDSGVESAIPRIEGTYSTVAPYVPHGKRGPAVNLPEALFPSGMYDDEIDKIRISHVAEDEIEIIASASGEVRFTRRLRLYRGKDDHSCFLFAASGQTDGSAQGIVEMGSGRFVFAVDEKASLILGFDNVGAGLAIVVPYSYRHTQWYLLPRVSERTGSDDRGIKQP